MLGRVVSTHLLPTRAFVDVHGLHSGSAGSVFAVGSVAGFFPEIHGNSSNPNAERRALHVQSLGATSSTKVFLRTLLEYFARESQGQPGNRESSGLLRKPFEPGLPGNERELYLPRGQAVVSSSCSEKIRLSSAIH